MYGVIVFVHSWLRWVVLAAAVVAVAWALAGLLRRTPWRARDDSVGLLLTVALDVQLLLGFVLYAFLSPTVQRAAADFGAAMADALLRYWAAEHVALGLLAVLVAHVARMLVQRAATDAGRHRRALVAYGVTTLLVLAAVPWPMLDQGRPWLRLVLP